MEKKNNLVLHTYTPSLTLAKIKFFTFNFELHVRGYMLSVGCRYIPPPSTAIAEDDGDAKRAHIYHYNEKIRKWEFILANDGNSRLPDERNLMAHPLETWTVESGLQYVLSGIFYSQSAANDECRKHKAGPPYQEGPRIYQLVGINRPTCVVTKPFLMNAFKIFYGDKDEYKMMPDKTSFEALKHEMRSLLKMNVVMCKIHHHHHSS